MYYDCAVSCGRFTQLLWKLNSRTLHHTLACGIIMPLPFQRQVPAWLMCGRCRNSCSAGEANKPTLDSSSIPAWFTFVLAICRFTNRRSSSFLSCNLAIAILGTVAWAPFRAYRWRRVIQTLRRCKNFPASSCHMVISSAPPKELIMLTLGTH